MLRHFGYRTAAADVFNYRCIRPLHGHRADVAAAVLFMRYDITAPALAGVGQTALSTCLLDLDGRRVPLSSLLVRARDRNRSLLVLAGSIT